MWYLGLTQGRREYILEKDLDHIPDIKFLSIQKTPPGGGVHSMRAI